MLQSISSSLMSRYVLIAEGSQSFHHSEMKKCEVDLKKGGCSSKSEEQEQNKNFRYDCENFARIVKIVQS